MRKLSIVILLLFTTISLYGCAKADIEKEPEIIEETSPTPQETNDAADSSKSDDTITEEDKNSDGITNQTEKELNEEKTSSNTDANSTGDQDANSNVTLTIEVEGMKETIDGKLHNSTYGYNMIYDSERFTYQAEDGVDSFVAENSDPEIYPYVYMNISQIKDTTLTEYADTLEKSLSTGYETVEKIATNTIGNHDAIQFRAVTGSEWNSVIRNYSIIDAGDSIYFVEMQYFTEAAEGYGSRMEAMLNTFTIRE